jgi:hypothetical protein
VKKGGKIYPLAWDIARELGKTYTLKDEKIWLQDNQSLAPYGLGSAWVSNTFHHYCLQFRNVSLPNAGVAQAIESGSFNNSGLEEIPFLTLSRNRQEPCSTLQE